MASVADQTNLGDFPKVIRIGEAQLCGHVKELLRESAEETLNALLDAEADAQCKAQR